MEVQETVYDNPASRLLTILRGARRQQQDRSAYLGWCEVFGVKEGDFASFFEHVARIACMTTSVRERIEKLEDERPELILGQFQQVESVMNNFTNNVRGLKMEQFLTPLREDSGEYCLEVCAARLHSRAPEPVLDEERREHLVSQVDELIDDIVRTDDLPDPTRDWLLSRLQQLRASLARPMFYSVDEIRSKTDELIGGMRRDGTYIEDCRRSATKEKILGFLIAIDLAVNIATGVKSITAGTSEGTNEPSSVVIEIKNNLEIPDDE